MGILGLRCKVQSLCLLRMRENRVEEGEGEDG